MYLWLSTKESFARITPSGWAIKKGIANKPRAHGLIVLSIFAKNTCTRLVSRHLPLVLSARANFTLNTLSSLIGSEAELLQQRIVMRSAAEVDILRAASILYEVVAGQKNMVPKNGEDDIIRLDTPRTTENKRKLERAACSVVALLIRIGRHDDASALMSSSVGSLKHTVAVDAEDRAHASYQCLQSSVAPMLDERLLMVLWFSWLMLTPN